MSIEKYLNQVHCCDCLELMKKLPDNCVDLVLTDPPYGLNMANLVASKSGQKYGKSACEWGQYNFSDWDKNIPNKIIFDEIFRVSKNQIICGGNYFTEFLETTKSWIVWDKRTEEKYSNNFADCEMIWTSFDKSAKIFRYLWSGMLQQDMKNKEKRVHPTQKPVALGEWILNRYSKKDEIILDCFCGSGSFLVACERIGRRWIGCEISQEYCDIANERIAKEQAQLKLNI